MALLRLNELLARYGKKKSSRPYFGEQISDQVSIQIFEKIKFSLASPSMMVSKCHDQNEGKNQHLNLIKLHKCTHFYKSIFLSKAKCNLAKFFNKWPVKCT